MPEKKKELDFKFSREDVGRVYVLKMVLPDDYVIHKVGMTRSDRAFERMIEVLSSWFHYYRFVPYTRLRLDQKSCNPLALEAHLHKLLRHKRFEPQYTVDGATEMFCEVDEFRLLHYIRQVTDTEVKAGFKHLTDEDYDNLAKLYT